MGKGGFFTTPEVAKRFRVEVSSLKVWVDEWERSGTLSPVHRTPGGGVGKGHRRFTQDQVDMIGRLLGQATVSPTLAGGAEGKHD